MLWGDAAAWPVQGLIRRFQPVIEERIANPQGFDFEAHFQHAWSGEAFANADWTKEFGGGKDVLVDPGLTEGPLADKPIVRPAADAPAHRFMRHPLLLGARLPDYSLLGVDGVLR